MEILRKNLLFSGLDEEQFAKILANSSQLTLKEGEVLFQQQQPASYFYFLKEGDIKLFRLSPHGGEKVIELIRAGQTFAEAVMFMHGNFYPVSAQALVDCTVIKVDMDTFRVLLENSAESSLKILGHMSRKLHGLVQEIDQLTLQNATMRVIQFLLKELPADATSPCKVQWNTAKTVLASRQSVRPETFSRILKQLAQEGLIKVDGKNIEVFDIDGLKQYP